MTYEGTLTRNAECLALDLKDGSQLGLFGPVPQVGAQFAFGGKTFTFGRRVKVTGLFAAITTCQISGIRADKIVRIE